MSYLEDQDQWWLPGIFRSVTLLGRPRGALDDVWLRTAYAEDGTGSDQPGDHRRAERLSGHRSRCRSSGVSQDFDDPGQVDGVRGRRRSSRGALSFRGSTTRPCARPGRPYACGSASGRCGSPATGCWSTARQVIFRGMNRHETHPVRGRMFDEDHARADLISMKRAGVNAIRTSHYPPHPRTLDLADELGLWVILECDLETHGFVFGGLAGQSERRSRAGSRPTWTGSSGRSNATRTIPA